MPLGYERLNERTQRPNACINFLKPLATSSPRDQEIAKDFLERIAAQCYPVMKKNHITVMALEEFPPNREFLGRNFNAGECIQLVLKDKGGRWLSFQFVQMVMMHELAHCKQMNHSKYFWQVRNQYANHMHELWAKKYLGEGMWGRGQDLTDGAFVHDRMPDNPEIPVHLCGGTYRSARGKKRKRGEDRTAEKPKPTHAERKQKQIAKKFGTHGKGHVLGGDELVRGALEQGHRGKGKPTVAKSKRGRNLSAKAALARLEAAKQQQPPEKTPDLDDDDDDDHEEDDDEDSETDSDDEFADGIAIMNTLEKIKDQRGRDLYKVCGDEGEQEEGGEKELDELRIIGENSLKPKADYKAIAGKGTINKTEKIPHQDSETESEPDDTMSKAGPSLNGTTTNGGSASNVHHLKSQSKAPQATTDSAGTHITQNGNSPTMVQSRVIACPICSLENESSSPTCMACSHVLKPSLMKNHWRCKSDQCEGTSYINAGDVGRCGLCGAQKPVAGESKAMGVVSADVLRWD